MADPSTAEFSRQIHSADRKMVVGVTGGGSRAISDLLTAPGGSRTVLEAIVPYSAAALSEFLRGEPEQFCSARTARAMAMAAFQRGRELQGAALAAKPPALPGDAKQRAEPKAHPAIGIGCTASLASDRPKRGAHRIHVALQTLSMTVTHSLELEKGRRSRAEEEDVAARMVLNAVAEAAELNERLTLPLVMGERVEVTGTTAPKQWQDLLVGRIHLVSALPSPRPSPWKGEGAGHPHPGPLRKGEGERQRVIFSGAFNPLHAGHLQMAEIASERAGGPVEFELSIENVDKPPLDYTEIEQRAGQFAERELPLWLTRAPTFVKKSELFPGATFVVGADTMARIGQARYYGGDQAATNAAIDELSQRGCRFLVFGRIVDAAFQTLADLKLPEALRKLCDEVPASEFREDVSSTEMRKAASD